MRAYDDQDILRLGNAFDRAWDQFLRTGMLTGENMSDVRHELAKRIFISFDLGEYDIWRLARDALFNVWNLRFGGTPPTAVAGGRRRRRERSQRQLTRNKTSSGSIAERDEAGIEVGACEESLKIYPLRPLT
jgi:hypothetical protein